MKSPPAQTAIVILATLLLCGCGGGTLFKITPRVEVAPEKFCCQTVVSDVFLAATPLVDEDEVLTTFDGNALLAGLLPVRVLVENRTGAPLELKRARFELYDGRGERYKELEPKKALERLVDYYGIRVQQKGAFQRTLEDLRALALPQDESLAAGDRRQGLIFFGMAPDGAVPANLKLVVKRLRPAPVKKDVEISLTLN